SNFLTWSVAQRCPIRGALSFFAHATRVSHAVENSEPRSIFVPYITFRGVQHWWTCGASDTAAARPLMTGRPDANFGLDKCRGLFARRTQRVWLSTRSIPARTSRRRVTPAPALPAWHPQAFRQSASPAHKR